MSMALDTPLLLTGSPVEAYLDIRHQQRAATDLAWPAEPPTPIARAIPTHDVFANVRLAGGIR